MGGVCVCVPLLFPAALKWVGLVRSLFLNLQSGVHVYLLPLPADWCLHRPAPGLCFCDVARAPVVVATLVLLLADAFASCTCPAGGFLVWSLRLLSINLFLFAAA